MKYTTIAISMELKQEIKEYGTKGETYADIIKRLVDSANKRMINDLLMDETNCVPVKDALKRAKKRWQK